MRHENEKKMNPTTDTTSKIWFRTYQQSTVFDETGERTLEAMNRTTRRGLDPVFIYHILLL